MAPQQTWLIGFYEAASSEVDLQHHLASPGGLFLLRVFRFGSIFGCQIRVVSDSNTSVNVVRTKRY